MKGNLQMVTNSHQETYSRVKKAVPAILFFFVFALIIDNSFKLISSAMAADLGVSATTISWQATLAGLIIGIGAVVYASLSDSVSIRNLLIIGVIFICIGSGLGFIFKESYMMILISRVIQTSGLAAAETLYVIYVMKYLKAEDQKLFLGLSTSSYSLSLVIGSVTGGFISTYLDWTILFLIPLLSLLLLPFFMKYIPKEESKKSSVDIIGLMLIAATATSIMLYMTNFNWIFIVLTIGGFSLFLMYIKRSDKALISIAFFQNKRFVNTLGIVAIVYSIQLGYIFMFPFLIQDIYGYELDKVSLLLIPGYIVAVIVGALSGKIGKIFSSKVTITTAIVSIGVSLFLPGLFVGKSVAIFVASMILFSGSFALLYAPLLDTCVGTIAVDKKGTAVGFYNLIINVSGSIGMSYTATMMDSLSYSIVLFVLAIFAAVAFLVYWLFVARLMNENAQ